MLGGVGARATSELLDALPTTAVGNRVRWLLGRLAAVGAGGGPPAAHELDEQFTAAWLSEVPMTDTFEVFAPLMSTVAAVQVERVRPDELTLVLDLDGGQALRMRTVVDDAAPHRISFVIFSRAMPPSSYVDRTVRRHDRTVHVRDFGGDGPLLVLWHGSGCDATVWEAVVPFLRSFRVVAQDLPGHGRSPHRRLTVAATVADTRAVLEELGVDAPILVGHSMGGWIAMHYAATNPCRALVCLDGPACVEYTAMGLTPDHPGWVPDAPDVRADLDALACPTLIALCSGASADERDQMVPFRQGLADHLTTHHPEVHVEWQPTGHMNILSMSQQTAALIEGFVGQPAA
jgi:pimeloyl-ACP methyl ester carboxylesterase